MSKPLKIYKVKTLYVLSLWILLEKAVITI